MNRAWKRPVGKPVRRNLQPWHLPEPALLCQRNLSGIRIVELPQEPALHLRVVTLQRVALPALLHPPPAKVFIRFTDSLNLEPIFPFIQTAFPALLLLWRTGVLTRIFTLRLLPTADQASRSTVCTMSEPGIISSWTLFWSPRPG